MKKILFAFLLVGAFAFSANATNSVLKSEAKTSIKKINRNLVKIDKSYLLKKIIDQYCSYFSYSATQASGNGLVSYSGLICAANESAFLNKCDFTMAAVDMLASFL